MKLGTQEHYDLMQAFERDHSGMRLDRENKDLWPKGHVYQNGETNSLFLAFRNGYAFCECVKRPAAIESLSAQCAQPQAGEPVADEREWCKLYHSRWPTEDLLKAREPGGLITDDGEAWKYHYTHSDAQGGPYDLVYRPIASAQPASPAHVTDAMVEMLAEFLCSEFDEDFNPCHGYSWPEHKDDDGYRGGNAYVKLQPSDVQARAREGATRILTFLSQRAALTAAIGAGGQALACKECDGTGFKDKNGARLTLARTPCGACAGSGYVAALSQPHPADERVVEALREAQKGIAAILENGGVNINSWWDSIVSVQQGIAAALAATEGAMTPKQKYDERKRLRLENDLRAEQRRKDRMDRDEDTEELIASIGTSLKRIADILEFWADMQKDGRDEQR